MTATRTILSRTVGRLLVAASITSATVSTAIAQQAAAPKPRVHVIATGGTISNLGDNARRTGEELVTAIPRLGEVARVTVEQFSNVASGSFTQQMWRDLAHRIQALARGPDAPAGYVVTHGTDTMEETAFFLDLTVAGCAPIIVTGAMRPANAVGADGPANLLNAVRVAAAPLARGRGAMILMNDEIFSARDATKSNTSRMNAFTGIDVGPMGIADPDTVEFYANAPQGECRPPRFDLSRITEFPRVDVIYVYIGADSVLVDALVANGTKGLVVAGVGRGGTTPSLGRALRRATERGVTVVVSNRTGSGRVGAEMRPEMLANLPAGRGATLGASNLNPQKARILLMLSLAARLDPPAMARLFSER